MRGRRAVQAEKEEALEWPVGGIVLPEPLPAPTVDSAVSAHCRKAEGEEALGWPVGASLLQAPGPWFNATSCCSQAQEGGRRCCKRPGWAGRPSLLL